MGALISESNQNVFSYIEVGLHWLAYQMDVKVRRTSNLYIIHPWKNGPKTRKKGGKQRAFTCNFIFDLFCFNTKFLKHFQRVLFLIKLQVFNSNCSEKNTPLEMLLRFCIGVNDPKSQNLSHICPLLQRQQLSPMI